MANKRIANFCVSKPWGPEKGIFIIDYTVAYYVLNYSCDKFLCILYLPLSNNAVGRINSLLLCSTRLCFKAGMRIYELIYIYGIILD